MNSEKHAAIIASYAKPEWYQIQGIATDSNVDCWYCHCCGSVTVPDDQANSFRSSEWRCAYCGTKSNITNEDVLLSRTAWEEAGGELPSERLSLVDRFLSIFN